MPQWNSTEFLQLRAVYLAKFGPLALQLSLDPRGPPAQDFLHARKKFQRTLLLGPMLQTIANWTYVSPESNLQAKGTDIDEADDMP